MGERGHDADWITRWVIRKCYRISKPSPDQIARYRYWHHVSRTVTLRRFGALGVLAVAGDPARCDRARAEPAAAARPA
jgi:hypothetical protein